MMLVRPHPIGNESARGYVLRLSEQNGLETPRWLLALLIELTDPSTGYLALATMLNRAQTGMAGLRGPIANLAQLNAPDLGQLPRRYWNTRRPRFCPCCLAESAHWRASWDLVFSVACHRHGVVLHEQCPQCQKSLPWDRFHVDRCACGFELKGSQTKPAPDWAVAFAREVELRMQPCRSEQGDGHPAWQSLDLEAWLKLVWFLGAYSRHAHNKPQKIQGLETLGIAMEMVGQAMAALEDWPSGFHRLLELVAARRQATTSDNKLSARFGSFYRALYKSFPGTEFDFLRQGFEDYVRDHWTGQLARRNRRLSNELRCEHEWVSIIDAAKQLRVRVAKVKQFLEEGQLAGYLHPTPSGRQMGAIRQDSLNTLVKQREDCITLSEARSILGISKKRAKALLNQGVLKPLGGPSVDGQPLWQFRRQDVQALVTNASTMTEYDRQSCSVNETGSDYGG